MRLLGPVTAEIHFDVSFHDVDMVGVVWHGHYLRYLEDARWALMRELDFGLEKMVASGFAWPIVEIQAKYLSPARFGDRLRARASLVEWESRLAVNYLITHAGTGSRILRARTVQVAVDGRTGELQFASPAEFIQCVRVAIERAAG